MPTPQEQFPHYFKDVQHLTMLDVYRVIDLWELHDPCLQHAFKKVIAAGKLGAKDAAKDVGEAIVSLQRWQDMQKENARSGMRDAATTAEAPAPLTIPVTTTKPDLRRCEEVWWRGAECRGMFRGVTFSLTPDEYYASLQNGARRMRDVLQSDVRDRSLD